MTLVPNTNYVIYYLPPWCGRPAAFHVRNEATKVVEFIEPTFEAAWNRVSENTEEAR